MFLKKLLFSLVIGLFSLLYAMEDFNHTRDINSSDISQKIIFLYIDSDSCEFCRTLDEMLNLPLSRLFLAYTVVVLEYNHVLLTYLSQVLSMPGLESPVYFLNNKEEAIIEPMRGEKTEEELLYFLNEAIRENQKTIIKKEKKPKNIWQKLFDK